MFIEIVELFLLFFNKSILKTYILNKIICSFFYHSYQFIIFFLIFLLNIENWSFLGGAPTSTVSLPSVCLSVHCTPYFRNCTSWSLFLERMCKMMISPSVFFFSFFFNFDFFGRYGGKMAKNSPKWKIKITSITHPISGTV